MTTLNFGGFLEIDVYVLWALMFGPGTMDRMSERTKIPASRLAPACNALIQRGFVKKDGDSFSLTDMRGTVLWFKETRPGTFFPPEHQ